MINNNEVVIIGSDHHNTLSVIRCLGKKKINFKLLIHENKKKSKDLAIYHSKYCKNMTLIDDNEKDILEYLLNNKNNNKQLIIPCSDLAEYTIDNNYEKLKNEYFIPGFKNNPGRVVKLMDKFEQKKWAEKNGINMAKSWYINLKIHKEIPDDIIYPCIIKPLISANSHKSEIRICSNIEELKNSIKIYKNNKYYDVLIQEFIKKRYELLAMGLIIDKNYSEIGGIERKLRESIPGGGGSTALGQFVIEKKIKQEVDKVLKQLYVEGYRGLYDIEFFECDDKIYLNEINFRHSGSGFALIDNGIEAPYLYYLYSINETINNVKLKYPNGYFFCDIGELNLLLKFKTITIFQFISDFIRSYSRAIFKFLDLGVLIYYVIKIIKRR